MLVVERRKGEAREEVVRLPKKLKNQFRVILASNLLQNVDNYIVLSRIRANRFFFFFKDPFLRSTISKF